MKWKDKLLEWKNGIIPKHNNLTKSFFWETSCVTKSLSTEYKEKYIENNELHKMKQNYQSFAKKINASQHKDVLSFFNLSKTSLLVVPKPRSNKKFTTLKQFMDNATEKQQKVFWRKVVSCIHKMLKTHDKVWVSTHGRGVPYLHVRIDTVPKYYLTKQFK